MRVQHLGIQRDASQTSEKIEGELRRMHIVEVPLSIIVYAQSHIVRRPLWGCCFQTTQETKSFTTAGVHGGSGVGIKVVWHRNDFEKYLTFLLKENVIN